MRRTLGLSPPSWLLCLRALCVRADCGQLDGESPGTIGPEHGYRLTSVAGFNTGSIDESDEHVEGYSAFESCECRAGTDVRPTAESEVVFRTRAIESEFVGGVIGPFVRDLRRPVRSRPSRRRGS